MALKKEKFKFLQTIHSEYKNILSDINQNLIDLRTEVEKLGPTYLE